MMRRNQPVIIEENKCPLVAKCLILGLRNMEGKI